jgi:hypothetical protein
MAIDVFDTKFSLSELYVNESRVHFVGVQENEYNILLGSDERRLNDIINNCV